MIIGFIIALLLGILAGTITGLSPGIHINLIATILLGYSAFFLNITSPITLVVFITAMAITHTFMDYIPSIFLGAPDEDSFLSVLPGHQLLLKGHGYSAVVLTLYGSLIALLIILIFTPFFVIALPFIYPYVEKIMWIILSLASVFLIYTEKERKTWALIIFLLAGFLGIATFNLSLKEPLLPMFTGLFGASNLLISLRQKTRVPQQKIRKLSQIRLNKRSFAKTTFASIIASPFTAFLPGLGASQAAIIGKEVAGELDQREFLFLLGAINTIVMGLSFISFYSIHKTRTGAAVAVSKLIPELTHIDLFIILGTIIIAGIISFSITILIAKQISKNINKIEYTKLSVGIIFILTAFVLFFSGPVGFLVFIISTSLGMLTILKGIKRINLMGCLMIPTILFYLL
jgi:putative membrane protein